VDPKTAGLIAAGRHHSPAAAAPYNERPPVEPGIVFPLHSHKKGIQIQMDNIPVHGGKLLKLVCNTKNISNKDKPEETAFLWDIERMRSALLIILLFACRQTANKDVRPDTDSISVISGDTQAKSLEGENSQVRFQEEKIRVTHDTTLFDASIFPSYKFESTVDSIYTLITFMTAGPPSPPGEDSEGGSYHRLVITTSGTQNGIYIESGEMNFEGGGRSIFLRKLIDDGEFVEKFSIQPRLSGVTFGYWRDWNSFVIEINGVEYIFKDIENSPVTVQVNK